MQEITVKPLVERDDDGLSRLSLLVTNNGSPDKFFLTGEVTAVRGNGYAARLGPFLPMWKNSGENSRLINAGAVEAVRVAQVTKIADGQCEFGLIENSAGQPFWFSNDKFPLSGSAPELDIRVSVQRSDSAQLHVRDYTITLAADGTWVASDKTPLPS